jgi:hypothetical protein
MRKRVKHGFIFAVLFLLVNVSGLPGQSQETIRSYPAWVWVSYLAALKAPPNLTKIVPPFGYQTLYWSPERNASGAHLGWRLIMGDADSNKLWIPGLPAASQTCMFLGEQFDESLNDPTVFLRHFPLPQGRLDVKILEYEVLENSLRWFTASCSYYPMIQPSQK